MEVGLNFTISCKKEEIRPIIFSRFYWRIYDAMCMEDGDDLTLWSGFLKISYYDNEDRKKDYKISINSTLHDIINTIENFFTKSVRKYTVYIKITKRLQVIIDKVLERDVDYDYDEDIYWHYCRKLDCCLEDNSKNFQKDQNLYIEKTTLNF